MITVALNHLSLFPTWIQQTILVLCGLILIASLVSVLIRIIRTAPMQTFYKNLQKLSVLIANHLRKQAEDPIPRPNMQRAALYSSVVICYVMSGLLVLIAVSFTILGAVLHQHITLLQALVLLGYIFLCWYVAAVLKAQGGRDRMRLWANATRRDPARGGSMSPG